MLFLEHKNNKQHNVAFRPPCCCQLIKSDNGHPSHILQIRAQFGSKMGLRFLTNSALHSTGNIVMLQEGDSACAVAVSKRTISQTWMYFGAAERLFQ